MESRRIVLGCMRQRNLYRFHSEPAEALPGDDGLLISHSVRSATPMLTPTTPGAIWPARLAYVAAGIFTAASGGTNLIYGWQKGGDLAGSLVWAGVAGAVAMIFALSWP